ncbi:hypothetical protein CgunFtcFv8_020425 [Champsocephalus gunnari]|uniref:Uncharacterized protein n=1 Tax=Champsocephalus gunnari TaxID=52237 RepID=A0AAN8E8V5_CHAGU|nr:hypothetical protein CgunFtcFv8_020425 [Champsocephalus gunnari]
MQKDMILLLASMGEYFVLPLLDMSPLNILCSLAGDETLRTAWCPLWPSTLQHDVCCSRGCPPRMQQGVTAEVAVMAEQS